MPIYAPRHLPSSAYVYVVGWTHLQTYYLGCRYAAHAQTRDLWTRYFTSSDYVRQFREAHGEPDIREVLFIGDRHEVLSLERECIRQYGLVDDPRWLNRANGTNPGKGRVWHHSEEDRRKKSEAMKALWADSAFREKRHIGPRPPVSQATRAAIREARARQVFSEETRAKLSAAGKRREVSDETRAKLSAASAGKVWSDEQRAQHSRRMKGNGLGRRKDEHHAAKISAALQGKPKSADHAAKLSASLLGKMKGVPKSEQTKARMREAAARRKLARYLQPIESRVDPAG